jgi:hypothetical protein
LKVGIRGFYDIARVWADSDDSTADYWHYGYGGGFYITPFREQFSFNISAGSSKEEPLLIAISIGSFSSSPRNVRSMDLFGNFTDM